MKKFFSLMALTMLAAVSAWASETVDITVPDSYQVTGGYVTTFSSAYALDFTEVEGIKAYVGKKKMDSYGDALESLQLTPVDKVPANTGVIIKAEEAKTYAVNVAEGTVDAVDNDLAVAAEELDLFEAIGQNSYGQFKTGPAVLKKGRIIDYNTFQYVEDALAFFPCDVPTGAGKSFLPAGTVYLPLVEADAADNSYFPLGVVLKFKDATVAEFTSIENILALDEGTEFVYKLDYMPQVTYANENYFVLEDLSGGLFVHADNSFKAGDLLYGSLRGVVSKQIGTTVDQADLSEVTVMGTYDVYPTETDMSKAFEENVQMQVKLTNLTVNIVEEKGMFGTNNVIYLKDADGNEVQLTTFLGELAEEIESLNNGDVVEEIVGYPVVTLENSIYVQYGLYNAYFFDPISMKTKAGDTYTVAGTFGNDDSAGSNNLFPNVWDPTDADNDMTLGADGVYTLTKKGVELGVGTIYYKVVKNHDWTENWGFEKGGANADYYVGEAGTYDVTFKFVPEGVLDDNSLSVHCILEKKAEELMIADWKKLDDGTEATLTLKDAQVNYVDEEGIMAIQDATGGMVLIVEGIEAQQGDRLNGQLVGKKVEDPMGFCTLEENDNTDVEAVQVSAGELVVKEVSIAEAKAEENRMVLVMVKDGYYDVEGYELTIWGMTINYPCIEKDDEQMMLYDGFMTDATSQLGDEYDGVDIAGLPIVAGDFEIYGIDDVALMPIPVPGDTNSDITTSISGAKKMIEKNGSFYNMNGVRVDNPQKGIFIQNGKKVVVK